MRTPVPHPLFITPFFLTGLNKKRFNRTRFIDSQLTARMAKLADAPDLGSGTARCVGSSPSPGIPFLRTAVAAPLWWGALLYLQNTAAECRGYNLQLPEMRPFSVRTETAIGTWKLA